MLALMPGGALLPRILEIPAPLAGKIRGGGGPADMLEGFIFARTRPGVEGCRVRVRKRVRVCVGVPVASPFKKSRLACA